MFIILFSVSIILILFGLISTIIKLKKKESYKNSLILTLLGVALLAYLLISIPKNLSNSGNTTNKQTETQSEKR